VPRDGDHQPAARGAGATSEQAGGRPGCPAGPRPAVPGLSRPPGDPEQGRSRVQQYEEDRESPRRSRPGGRGRPAVPGLTVFVAHVLHATSAAGPPGPGHAHLRRDRNLRKVVSRRSRHEPSPAENAPDSPCPRPGPAAVSWVHDRTSKNSPQRSPVSAVMNIDPEGSSRGLQDPANMFGLAPGARHVPHQGRDRRCHRAAGRLADPRGDRRGQLRYRQRRT